MWAVNGGHESDQQALTDDHVAWLRSLPVMARHGDYLLMHSDTTDYLEWGDSVDDINSTVSTLVAGDDAEALWEVFATLTSRHDFAGGDGARVAEDVLAGLRRRGDRARAQHHLDAPTRAVGGASRARSPTPAAWWSRSTAAATTAARCSWSSSPRRPCP